MNLFHRSGGIKPHSSEVRPKGGGGLVVGRCSQRQVTKGRKWQVRCAHGSAGVGLIDGAGEQQRQTVIFDQGVENGTASAGHERRLQVLCSV